MRLKAGILIIGSLDWESRDYGGPWACEQKPHRVEWRRTRLADEEFLVEVPVRYGRKSSSRNHTYTMIVSPAAGLGVAKAVRCTHDIVSIDDLTAEAEELWFAEGLGENRNGLVSASWGRVAIVVPPGFLNEDESGERKKLLDGWDKRFSSAGETNPAGLGVAFSADDKARVENGQLIEKGILKLDWPHIVAGEPLPLDLLLLTVTKPTLTDGHYPTPDKIAAAWNRNGHSYYYRCNRVVGITTADDPEIEKTLGSGHFGE